MVTADMHALFAPLKPSAERGGERLSGESFADPSQGLLEAFLVKWEASQLLLYLCKQEEVRRGEIQHIERVGDQQDGTGGEPVLAAVALMTGEFFQPQISVKNGSDGEIR